MSIGDVVIGVLITAVGGLGTWTGGLMTRDRFRLRAEGIVVHGTIEESRETGPYSGRRLYVARVRFTTTDGRELVHDAMGRHARPFEAGHPIVVRYLPGSPPSCR